MSYTQRVCGNIHPSYRHPAAKWIPTCDRAEGHPGYHAKGLLYWQDVPESKESDAHRRSPVMVEGHRA